MQRPPRINLKVSEDYQTMIVSGFYGGHRPEFFEAIIYTDELDGEEALSEIPPDPNKIRVKRTLQCRLYFTPVMTKDLKRWLEDHIGKYEKQFGEIKLGEKSEDKDKGLYI